MGKRESYHTKQKDVLLRYIKDKKNEFTIKDLYEGLNKKIGLTTIYRYIDELAECGRVSKYIGQDNITYYQYLEECHEENHFYLKCDVCGNLIHVDCDCINELSNHIVSIHHFKIVKEPIIIHGVCCNCNEQ